MIRLCSEKILLGRSFLLLIYKLLLNQFSGLKLKKKTQKFYVVKSNCLKNTQNKKKSSLKIVSLWTFEHSVDLILEDNIIRSLHKL